ncbi:hypothetical protein TNCV_2700001 [Trichonephila clavipes]|nr:hypothetical protein TNCV_2700001 [Trichonephila clavipes]
MPDKLSNKWVRDQKSVPLAGASRIEEYSADLRTVAVRQRNSGKIVRLSLETSPCATIDKETSALDHRGIEEIPLVRQIMVSEESHRWANANTPLSNGNLGNRAHSWGIQGSDIHHLPNGQRPRTIRVESSGSVRTF